MKKRISIAESLIGNPEKFQELKTRARRLRSDYTTELLDLIRKAKPTLSESQIVLVYRSIN